jgi:hypothetical protein
VTTSSRTVITEDGTEIQIERSPRPLPLPEPKDLTALKRRMTANPHINLSPSAIEAAVGVFIDLPKVTRIATYEADVDGLSSQYAGSTHLYAMEGEADAESPSFVLGNPRLGHLLRGLPNAPRVTGVEDENGSLLAELRVEFDSVEDAERLIESTVRETLKEQGANYSDSILGHGVMTAVEAVVVEVAFLDGSPSVFRVVPFDGTSRLASAALVRYHDVTMAPAEGVAHTARVLRRSLRVSQRKRRADYLREAAAINVAHGRDGLTMPVLRQLQARRIPLRLIVGAEFSQDGGTDELPAAIATAQSTRHISVNPWREAAKDTVTAQRTVQHLLQASRVSDAFMTLADHQVLTARQVKELFGSVDQKLVLDADGRARPLWRAVVIVHRLTDEAIMAEAKRFIRSDQGVASVQPNRYAGFVGVLVDMPWKWAKPQTTDAARNAWRNGGVLSEQIFEEDWVPLIASVEELVELADAGDVSARLTLQVIAGTALIADGILTRDRGSKIGEDGVTYRAAPPLLLTTWIETSHGRLQAHEVVQTFRHDQAGGSGTGRSVQADYTYKLVGRSGALVRDGETFKILKEGDLFDQANPKRAEEERLKLETAKKASQKKKNLSREEMNELRRSEVLDHVGRAATLVQQLAAEVPDFPQKLSEHPFGQRADWQLTRGKIHDLGESLVDVAPPQPPPPPLFEDDEDAEQL